MRNDDRADQIRARLTDCEDEEGTVNRPLWWLDSPAGDELIRNAPADLAWPLAERAKGQWWPGRWWRAVDPEGNLWCESSDEQEVRSMARPTDRVQQIYNFTTAEWRDEN